MVKGCDIDGVVGGDCVVFFFVVKNEGEYVIEVFGCINVIFEVLLYWLILCVFFCSFFFVVIY